MAKYNELIKENQALIQNIKNLIAKRDEIKIRLDEAYEDSADGQPVNCEAIEDEMANNQIALSQAQERLTEIVERAYWDVPYAKTRNQGITKFWELSGVS